MPDRARFIAVFALSALVLLAATYGYYRVEVGRIRELKYREISAVGELKAAQIKQWREERLADVQQPAISPFFRRALQDWQRSGFKSDLASQWKERLNLERKRGFADALLFDPDGNLILSGRGDAGPVDQATSRAVNECVNSGNPTLSDLYRAADGHMYTDAAATVLDTAGAPIAVLVQRNDAVAFLFPLVQSWPTASRSAEIYLVHRERQEAVVLSDLRDQPRSALSYRYPLTQTDRPAVRAVLGTRGVFEGLDYRGVRVLADLRAIPGSPWYQVVKVDADEFLAEARFRAGVSGLVGALFVLLAGAAVAWWYRQRQARLYRGLYPALTVAFQGLALVVGA